MSRSVTAAIQDMLQLANLLSEDKEPLPEVELDIAEVLKWCVGQVQNIADERGITIESSVQSAKIICVEDHLKMLLQNVLSNAVIYSHERGRVKVQCTEAPGEGPVVTIEDQGIGISENKLPRIFDEYYVTREAARHNKSSTGLGLAIVRHVAKAHRIRVEVESAVGVGTKFTLHFPSLKRKQTKS